MMLVGGGGDSRVREREQGERRRARKSARGVGVAWRRAGSFRATRGAPGKQGGWWRGAVARARAGHAPLPLSRTKTTEEEAGWAACWLGRPAAAGPEAPGRSPGKVFPVLFLFLNFLTFVLI